MSGRGLPSSPVALAHESASASLEEISRRVYLAAGIDRRFADPRTLCWALGFEVRPVGPEGTRIALPRNVLPFTHDPDDGVWGMSLFSALALRLVGEVEDAPTEELVGYLAAPPSLVRFFGRMSIAAQPFVPAWWMRSWARRWLL